MTHSTHTVHLIVHTPDFRKVFSGYGSDAKSCISPPHVCIMHRFMATYHVYNGCMPRVQRLLNGLQRTLFSTSIPHARTGSCARLRCNVARLHPSRGRELSRRRSDVINNALITLVTKVPLHFSHGRAPWGGKHNMIRMRATYLDVTSVAIPYTVLITIDTLAPRICMCMIIMSRS
jgi:hypothetical protein